MTERAIIFIIVAATIVAVTLIGGITAILKAEADATREKASAVIVHDLKEMGVRPDGQTERD